MRTLHFVFLQNLKQRTLSNKHFQYYSRSVYIEVTNKARLVFSDERSPRTSRKSVESSTVTLARRQSI